MHLGSKIGFAAVALVLMNASIAGQEKSNVALSQRVTADFKSAPLSEVLKWLSSQGLSFVVKDGTLDGRLTIHIANQPLKDAADAIAKAMGGRWDRNGDVFTLKSGSDGLGMLRYEDFKVDGTPKTFTIPNIQDLPAFKFSFPDDNVWSEADKKAFKDQMLKFKQSLPNLKVWTDQDGKILERDLSKMKIDEKELKAFKDKMSEFKLSLPDVDKLKRLELDLSKVGDKSFIFKAEGIRELMKSLTKEQWEKHEKQGYLKPSDLSPDQIKMLGNDRDGEWTLSFTIDGKSLTIKSKG